MADCKKEEKHLRGKKNLQLIALNLATDRGAELACYGSFSKPLRSLLVFTSVGTTRGQGIIRVVVVELVVVATFF